MNWKYLRSLSWLDTRAKFVDHTPESGTLLDIGSSDGETLSHFAELRPDLRLFATDLEGAPERYPSGTQFHRGDIQEQKLPWPDRSFDSITCMHLVEHLRDHEMLFREIARLLKPGGRAYFETPHPKTVELPSAKGLFTLNFFDDPTHTSVITPEALSRMTREAGLSVTKRGVSRNWLFAFAYPAYFFQRPSRKKFTAYVHWLGWSFYLMTCRDSEHLKTLTE
jgi:2-polyprenyl-3-methyl-5-hydroxy-6-metoxy-1,4-benzoquinol methylase